MAEGGGIGERRRDSGALESLSEQEMWIICSGVNSQSLGSVVWTVPTLSYKNRNFFVFL